MLTVHASRPYAPHSTKDMHGVQLCWPCQLVVPRCTTQDFALHDYQCRKPAPWWLSLLAALTAGMVYVWPLLVVTVKGCLA